MSAKWIEGKSKKYGTVEIPKDLDVGVIREIIRGEIKGKWRFFAMAVLFLALSFAFAFLGLEETTRKVWFEIPEKFSFKGGIAGLALIGAGFSVWCARVKIKIVPMEN